MSKRVVRSTISSDIDVLLRRLQATVYPGIKPWQRNHLVQQLEVFPRGPLVAVPGERIVRCASSLVILWDEWSDEHNWSGITAAGTFDTHNPPGFTLYGAKVFVDPRLRRSL